MDNLEKKYISSVKIPGSSEKRYIKDTESRVAIGEINETLQELNEFAFVDHAEGDYTPHGKIIDANIVIEKSSKSEKSVELSVNNHILTISPKTISFLTDVSARHEGVSQFFGTKETIRVGKGSNVYYKVTFHSDVGSLIPEQYVLKGGVCESPIIHPVTGKSFEGWYLDEGIYAEPFDFTTPITENTELYALWEESTVYHTVKFVTNSETVIPEQIVEHGGVALKPTDPEKYGYEFLDWITPSGDSYDFETPVYTDITLTATWDEYEWHIRMRVKEALVDLPSPGTIKDCVDRIVAAGIVSPRPQTLRELLRKLKTPLDIVHNFETFLQYYHDIEPTRYIITFDSQGGSAVLSQAVIPGGVAEEPQQPTKEGYLFDGWYTDNTAFTTRYDFRSAVYSNKTLYAKWIDATVYYTVTFESNGGTSVPPQTIAEGGVAVRPDDPTKEGYSFRNWYADAELTSVYDFASSIVKDTVLYAGWDKTYLVEFDSDGGSEVQAQVVKSGEKAVRPVNPIKDGYDFINWYSNEEKTVIYDFNAAVTTDLVLYAKWDETEPHIRQRAKEALRDLTFPCRLIDIVDKLLEAEVIPERPEKIEDLLRMLKTPSSIDTLEKFVEYYYGPLTDKYTVTFDSNGGSHVFSQIVPKNGLAFRPNNPKKAGATFENWYSDATLTIVYDFSTPVIANITLYAKWNEGGDIRERVRIALTGIDRKTCTVEEVITRLVNAGIITDDVKDLSTLMERLGTPSSVTNLQEFLEYYLGPEGDIRERVTQSLKDVSRTRGTIEDVCACLIRDGIIQETVTDLEILKSVLNTPDDVITIRDFLNYYSA